MTSSAVRAIMGDTGLSLATANNRHIYKLLSRHTYEILSCLFQLRSSGSCITPVREPSLLKPLASLCLLHLDAGEARRAMESSLRHLSRLFKWGKDDICKRYATFL
jgi:hypothetical protein